jgi:hypothetical protein
MPGGGNELQVALLLLNLGLLRLFALNSLLGE